MEPYEFGEETAFPSLPAEVTIRGEDYYLTKDGDQYALLSRICPHAGGTVRLHGQSLFCPIHFWSFDVKTGECTSMPDYCLDKIAVVVKDGRLLAQF
ncbi:Rieske (2Fe-2S) protein [Paenibacillus montanisoli]|uniref:Rieske (2Fe-2S) protein n=1 Tax=Paenibacillus montanisoli TaxID=2081970 RepID=A0A328U6I6_9BACL|nr:Rieske (2Fe-2S) protein [Paenibacillus montanisoli]RAP76565.1 Rieske (2Fe-2S) protein [Paenibacillus montanisoli]